MKRFTFYGAAVLYSAVLLAMTVSCTDNTLPEPIFNLDTDAVEVEASGCEKEIIYIIDNPLDGVLPTAVPDCDWVNSIDCSEFGIIRFNVDANEQTEPREAVVSVSYNGGVVGDFKVIQAPYEKRGYSLSVSEISSDNAVIEVGCNKPECSYFIWLFNSDEYDEFTAAEQLKAFSEQGHEDCFGTASKKWTFDGLNEECGYVVCLLSLDEDSKYEVTVLDFTTELKENSIDVNFCIIEYWGSYFFDGTSNFVVKLGNVGLQNGAIVSDGEIVYMSVRLEEKDKDFYPTSAGDFLGTYSFDENTVPGSIGNLDSRETYLGIISGNASKETPITLKEAHMRIEEKDGKFRVIVRAIRQDGRELVINYDDEIIVDDESFHGYTGPQLDEDKNMDCDYMRFVWYEGEVEGCDFYTVSFMEDPDLDDPTGGKNKNSIVIKLYMPVSDKPLDRLLDGTYEFTYDIAPGIALSGEFIQHGIGSYSPQGSYYYRLDPNQPKTVYGFIESGTVSVVNNEDGTLEISVDSVTDKGAKVIAVYKGEYSIVDRS